MRKLLVAAAAALALVGCGTPEPTMTPVPKASATPTIPDGGEIVETEFGPAGLSMPEGAIVVERIDQVNNVTLVFSAPTGAELAAYYRKALPELGFGITEDANNSLLFGNEEWTGGFTASGSHSALTLRTDWG